MDINEIFIDGSDFTFFQELPDSEKILCLFDIMLSEPIETESISDIIDSSINTTAHANIVITNDLIIINSDEYKLIKSAANHLMSSGYVLERLLLGDAGVDVFKRQKFCLVYSIIGTSMPICYN
jgi:hypothetical protein